MNIDITELEDGTYEYDQVQIRPGRNNYAGIVDALISHKYPTDKMQAVMNNYMAAQTDEAIEEFDRMQRWRAEAKAIAREIFPDE